MSARSEAAIAWRGWPWLAAGAGLLFDVAAYWPGHVSFDAAYAWWQARGGTTSDLTSPLFVRIWRGCEAIASGPGLPFVLHLLLFWSGLALLVRALGLGVRAVLATLALAAFAPVPLLLRGHVWTDVGLFAALTFATGTLACAQAEGRRGWLLAALPALFLATGLRHNALPAIAPFALWWAALAWRGAGTSFIGRGATALGLLGALALLVQAVNAGVDRRVPLWPSLAQWDLAAISVGTGRMWLPDFMQGPGLDVADLAQAFQPWSNVPMLQRTRHGLRDPFDDYTPAELATLRRTWQAAVTAEPRAWLAHRWRLTRALFGVHVADWPRELVYVDAMVGYRDNPPLAHNDGALHEALMQAAARAHATAVLAAWPYLALGLCAVPVAWRRRASAAGRVAGVLLASAWAYALPLTVLAPSAELRYLGWPCVASLLALACVLFASRAPGLAGRPPTATGRTDATRRLPVDAAGAD
jgi:hypothetical protein